MSMRFGEEFLTHKRRGTNGLRGPISSGSGVPEANLFVDPNGSDHSDSYTRAQIIAAAGARQWDTIGRAVWGSSDRSTPSSTECAQPGDVVAIKGSANSASPTLYTTNVSIRNNSTPVYLPAITGTAGNYITFVADGYVRLGAPAANSPVIGNSGTRNYIKWYADRATARFFITCDGRMGTPVNIASSSASGGVLTINTSSAHGFTTGDEVVIRNHNSTPAIGPSPSGERVTATVIDSDTFTINDQTYTAGGGATGNVRLYDDVKADTSVVNTRPDTGAAFLTGAAWIEGFDIDGGELVDYGDNWDGIVIKDGIGFTVRNCYIHDFRKDQDDNSVEDTTHNQAGITTYGIQDGTIENNLIKNCGTGIYFKDTLSFIPTYNNTIRRNWITNPDILAGLARKGITWSLQFGGGGGLAHDTNFLYQNVIVDCSHGFSNNSGQWDDDVYNNTLYNCDIGFEGLALSNGSRYWNNIVATNDRAIYQESVNFPTDTDADLEHNCYDNTSATFMEDASGNHTFAAYLSEYPSQDQAATASVDADPLFTNAAAFDFTLQSGSPARGIASTLGVGGDAGAYQFGVSVTIGLEAGQP